MFYSWNSWVPHYNKLVMSTGSTVHVFFHIKHSLSNRFMLKWPLVCLSDTKKSWWLLYIHAHIWLSKLLYEDRSSKNLISASWKVENVLYSSGHIIYTIRNSLRIELLAVSQVTEIKSFEQKKFYFEKKYTFIAKFS